MSLLNQIDCTFRCVTAMKMNKFCDDFRIRDYYFSNDLKAPTIHARRPIPSAHVGVKCTTYRCFAQQASSARDLRHLENLHCRSRNDCMSESTGMVCREFDGYNDRTLSLCDCPRGQAYNPRACKCQDAEPCNGSVSTGTNI